MGAHGLPQAGANVHDDDPLRAKLNALVDRAATMKQREGFETERLRADAHAVMSQLVAAGRLPVDMTIAPDDPLVVVIRTLAMASRRVSEGRQTTVRDQHSAGGY